MSASAIALLLIAWGFGIASTFPVVYGFLSLSEKPSRASAFIALMVAVTWPLAAPLAGLAILLGVIREKP